MKKTVSIGLLTLISISLDYYQIAGRSKSKLRTVFAFDACPSEFLETDGSVITFSGDAVPDDYGHVSYFNTELKITCDSNEPFNCFCNDTISTQYSIAPICCTTEKYTETFNIQTTGIPDHFAQIFNKEITVDNNGQEQILTNIMKETNLNFDIPTCPHKYLPDLSELSIQDNTNPRTLNGGIVGISILGVPIYSPFTYNSNTNTFQYVTFNISQSTLANVDIPSSITSKYSSVVLTLDTCQGYVSTSTQSSNSDQIRGEYRYHTGPICSFGSKYLHKDDCRYFQRKQGKGYSDANCKPQGWSGVDFQNDDPGTYERYIVGYAVDGFPIYATSPLPTDDELDNCNGKFDFNAQTGKYKYAYYVTTNETHAYWPYTIGCFGPGTHYKNGQEIDYTVLGIDPLLTVDTRCSKTPQPTNRPTQRPTQRPTLLPTVLPTALPTKFPTSLPTSFPTTPPTALPTTFPTSRPTSFPTKFPTSLPTSWPTVFPTSFPTTFPTVAPTAPTSLPTVFPTSFPTTTPSALPTASPTFFPTMFPTMFPTSIPTRFPSSLPTLEPTAPTSLPSTMPSSLPTTIPTSLPTSSPTPGPTSSPTAFPTNLPTMPTSLPTSLPTQVPSMEPTSLPTSSPTPGPTSSPTAFPTNLPTMPTSLPTSLPTQVPSMEPTSLPTSSPTPGLTSSPTAFPTNLPTNSARGQLSSLPTETIKRKSEGKSYLRPSKRKKENYEEK